jgi:hypothetical protein
MHSRTNLKGSNMTNNRVTHGRSKRKSCATAQSHAKPEISGADKELLKEIRRSILRKLAKRIETDRFFCE